MHQLMFCLPNMQRMGRDVQLLPTNTKEDSSPNKLKGILTSLLRKAHSGQVWHDDGLMGAMACGSSAHLLLPACCCSRGEEFPNRIQLPVLLSAGTVRRSEFTDTAHRTCESAADTLIILSLTAAVHSYCHCTPCQAHCPWLIAGLVQVWHNVAVISGIILHAVCRLIAGATRHSTTTCCW